MAARCARAAKELAVTCPPPAFAVLDWIRAAAWQVMGDGDLDDLNDMFIPSEVVVHSGRSKGYRSATRPSSAPLVKNFQNLRKRTTSRRQRRFLRTSFARITRIGKSPSECRHKALLLPPMIVLM